MVNSLNGISAADYRTYMKVQQEMAKEGVSTPNLTYANDSTQFSTSGCTDGKDDGKIGFWGALGNATKGVFNSIKNGIKAVTTNSKGEFSLGKTILTLGATAAVGFLCPGLLVGAGIIGGVAGGVKLGKGVINAATAKTDGEAKQAWQNIGSGTFDVALSVAGVKAGVNAVKATSTAANGLSSLDDTASLAQKATALGKDIISSTKNQVGKISNAATPYVQAAKVKSAQIKASKIKNTGALTPDELHTLQNAKYQEMFASDKTKAILSQIDDMTSSVKGYKAKAVTKLNNSEFATGVQMLREAIKSGNADDIAAAKALLKEASIGKAQMKFNNSEFGTGLQMLREAIKSGNADDIAAAKALLKEASIGKAQIKFDNSEFGTGLQMLKEAIKSGNADEIATAKTLMKECITSSKIYGKTVQSDVVEALKMLVEAQKTGNIEDAAFAKEYLAFLKDNFLANAGEYATSIQQHLGLDSVALEETIQSILNAYKTPKTTTV